MLHVHGMAPALPRAQATDPRSISLVVTWLSLPSLDSPPPHPLKSGRWCDCVWGLPCVGFLLACRGKQGWARLAVGGGQGLGSGAPQLDPLGEGAAEGPGFTWQQVPHKAFGQIPVLFFPFISPVCSSLSRASAFFWAGPFCCNLLLRAHPSATPNA